MTMDMKDGTIKTALLADINDTFIADINHRYVNIFHRFVYFLKLFAQWSCSYNFLLGVCLSVRLLTFYIFNFFSRTIGLILTKADLGKGKGETRLLK